METPTSNMETPTSDISRQDSSQEWLKNWQSDALQPYADWKIFVSAKNGHPERSVYRVHRLVLGASPRSSGYFASVFQSEMMESQENSSRIELEDARSVELFPHVLDFIYSGTIDVQYKVLQSDEAKLGLFLLADYFDIPSLKKEIIQCCITAIEDSEMEKIKLYLDQTNGRDNMKELFDAIIQFCGQNVEELPKCVGDLLKPQWLVCILQAAVDEEADYSLPHIGDELIARCLFSHKDGGIEIDTMEELLSFVKGDLTPQNAVRFLTIIDTFNFGSFDDNAEYETFVDEAFDTVTKTPAVDVEVEGAVTDHVDQELGGKELKDAEDKLLILDEKLEEVDLDSFLSDESSVEFNEHGSFRAQCLDTVINGWEELCGEDDQEMIDLISKLGGEVLFAMAKAACDAATCNRSRNSEDVEAENSEDEDD